ncbi:hypothetical protein ACHAXR_007804 [Thalassiosira sp. AJA248-18]
MTMATRPRSTRTRVVPTSSSSRRITSSARVTNLVGKHHPPDMAAGGGCYVGKGTAVPLYCPEIKSSTSSSRKGVDPPDINESRYNRLRSLHKKSTTSHCLDPVAEDSCEDNASRSFDPPDTARQSFSTSQKNATPKKNYYSNYQLDSIGYLQYQRRHQKQTESRVASKEHDDRYQQRRKQQQKKTLSSSLNPRCNHDISELASRGLDPPDRHHSRKPTKTDAHGPRDPPAHDGSVRSALHRRLTSQRKCTGNRRATRPKAGGRKTSSSAPKRSHCASPPKPGDRHPSISRSSKPMPNQCAAATPSNGVTSKQEKNIETFQIKSILKKKDTPTPIAFFGGQSSSSGSSSRSEMSKSKSSCKTKNTPSMESGSDDDDDTLSIDMTSDQSINSMKSSLRRGKFAASANDFSSSGDEDSLLSMSSISFKFDRTRSHYMRTGDLGLRQDTIFAAQFLDYLTSTPEPHYHHPTPRPPPGVQFHIDENWICVDDGNGGHSPIAPQAVDALVLMGYRAVTDPQMWTPTARTRKVMTEKSLSFDDIPIPGPIFEGEGGANDTSCLLWSGKFNHRYHGSELPVIRSVGIVNKTAEELVDLLMDSSRVDEYNKSSVGRIDDVVLSYGNNLDCPFSGRNNKKRLTGVVMQGAKIVDGTAYLEPNAAEIDFEGDRESTTSSRRGNRASKFVGVTKLVRSTNKLPLIKKALEFTTLLHCRELLDEQGGNGFIIVGRSITPGEHTERVKGVIRSEVLLNVSIIRRLHQSDGCQTRSVSVSDSGRTASKKDLQKRCLLITMNHVKSPLIPKLIAKRVGLSAAANFMSDIRSA